MSLLLKNSLIIGDLELNRMQELQKQDLWDVISGMIKTYGLFKNNNTGLTVWQVSQAGDNSITIKAGRGIIQDASGNPVIIMLKEDTTLNVPATNGTYKILVKQKTHNFEKGTVTLSNSSKVVTGVGTEFLKIIGPDRRLIINNVSYPVELVSSDVSLQLYTQFSGTTTSGNQFSVGGNFATPPAAVSDMKIYEHDGGEILVTTASKGTYEYWLAEVTIVNSVISTITDKRDLNLMSFDTQSIAELIIPHTWTISGDVVAAVGDVDYINPFFISSPSGQVVNISSVVCRCNSGACNFKLVKASFEGGIEDILGLGSINAGVSTSVVDPSDILLTDKDYIKPVINNSSSAKNLTITVNLKYKVAI